ncbi:MAG: hypothetical protein WBA28_09190 [Microbacteriaceae bacterium]
MGDIGVWGLVVAILSAIGTICVAFYSDYRVKQANEIAQAANDIAAEALRQAAESNNIAEDANELSREANRVISTQAAQKIEKWLVEWVPEWDADTLSLILKNTGRDTAHNPTVLIKGRDIDQFKDGLDDVPRGEQISIAFPEFLEERRAENERKVETHRRSIDSGIVIGFRGWSKKLTITVIWHTGLGQPQEQIINLNMK